MWSFVLIYYLWREGQPKYREFIAAVFFTATSHIAYMVFEYHYQNSIASTVYGAYVTTASIYLALVIRLEILGIFKVLDPRISPKAIWITQIVIGVYFLFCCAVYTYDATIYNEFSNFLGYIVLAGFAGSTSAFAGAQTWYMVQLIYTAKKKAKAIMSDAFYVINLMIGSIVIEWSMLGIYVLFQRDYPFVKILAALAPRVHMNFVVLIFAAMKKMVFYGVKLNKIPPALAVPAIIMPATVRADAAVTLSN
jgi:hypothetical protein